MAYYAENPFTNCHPTFVTIDDQTGRIFQAETAGNPYRFNMEDYLNEKYKNASDKYGSETCSVAEPSLCGGFKTGLKVSFDDWLTELDQGNTWSEFSEQRGEFQKAYEALQAEEKKKQRKAPPATQNQKVAYTSPWQAVINWARGAAGSSTSPGASVTPPTSGYTPPSSSPSRPSLPPPGQLPPSTRPSLPPFGGSGPSKLRPEGTDEEEETKPTSPPSTGPVGGGGASGGGTTVGGSSGSFGGVSVGGGMRRAETFESSTLNYNANKEQARQSFFKEMSYEGNRLTTLGRNLENRNYKNSSSSTEYRSKNMKYFSGDKGQEGKYYIKEGKKINDARVPKKSKRRFSLRKRLGKFFKSEDLTVDNLKAIGGSMLLGVGLLVGGSVVANEVYKRVKK